MADIAFNLADHRINLRVGGVLRREGKVLLCRNPNLGLWYTPGGRIRVGEDSATALRRELQEELDLEFELGRPLVVGENFFTFRDEKVHEVCFYHEAVDNGREIPATTPDGEELHWISLDALKPLKLVPRRPQPGLQQIVHRD